PDGVLKEALCAVLAKELNLPITQPYLVDLSNIRQYFAGLRYSTPAFGLERSRVPSFKFRTQAAQDALLKWPELLRCAVFDIWIGNGDRFPGTNLTFERNGTIWIFDHDDALAAHLSPATAIKSQLLQLLVNGK